MAVKEKMFPLSKVLLLPDGRGINRGYVDIILSEDIPILCINRSLQKKRLMPFKVLYDNNETFWLRTGNWEYFLTEESINKINEKSAVKTDVWNKEIPKTEKHRDIDNNNDNSNVDSGFGNDYKTYVDMSNEEKVDVLNNDRKRLNTLISLKNKDEAVVAEALVDTTKDAALINHAVLEKAIMLGDDEAKKYTQEIVNTTNEMVKSSTQLVSEDFFSNELMSTLVKKSNGTIVQHITRVYLNGIAFLSYYNNLVSTSSAIQKFRVSFASKYRKYYHSLLPHIPFDDVSLERVFYGGMRAVAPELCHRWAIGFLIHDIGKAAEVEYHEGESKYDRSKVVNHVKQGYISITTKTNYPMEASLMTGYHHEYYGDSTGYGYFRAYLQQYKKDNPDAKQDYCITYELEPVMDYQALAYFPAKILEIIDVYDSITDPFRVYRKPLTPLAALDMMRDEFIEKKLKIDPILFSIFDTFIREKYSRNATRSF